MTQDNNGQQAKGPQVSLRQIGWLRAKEVVAAVSCHKAVSPETQSNIIAATGLYLVAAAIVSFSGEDKEAREKLLADMCARLPSMLDELTDITEETSDDQGAN